MMNLLGDYETWMRSWGASDRTIEARVRIAKSRLNEWGGPHGFTAERIQEWLARPELRSGWSRATYLTAISDFCAWMVAAGYMDSNPAEGFRRPKTPSASPRPLSEQEVERILASAQGDVRTWFLLALLQGLRASEIAAIQGRDVTERDLWVHGKGDKSAILPTHPDIWVIAQTMPAGPWFTRADGSPIEPRAVSLGVGAYFRALGISGSVHRGRHTYATRLLRSGVHIRTVQKLMRHSSLATTANYTAVDESELREAINRLRAA